MPQQEDDSRKFARDFSAWARSSGFDYASRTGDFSAAPDGYPVPPSSLHSVADPTQVVRLPSLRDVQAHRPRHQHHQHGRMSITRMADGYPSDLCHHPHGNDQEHQ